MLNARLSVSFARTGDPGAGKLIDSMNGNGQPSRGGGRRANGANRGPREPKSDEHSSIEVLDPHALMSSPSTTWLTEHASAALRVLACRGEVRVRVVDDVEMAAAHEQYSGVAGTTDVLTFDLREDPSSGEPLDTDILVCMDEARRQAADRGIAPERELLLYVLHGVLHCLGYDDHDEAVHRAMHAEEDRVLEAIGVGRTFAAPIAGEGAL